MKSQRAINYLTKRKISLATARILQLGYGPEAGRFKATQSNYTDRILFPIHDLYGEVVAYQGRALYDYKAAGKPKYWHQSFQKSENLYGLYENLNQIKKVGHVILVESNFCVASGVEVQQPCVTTNGSTISDCQMFMLSSLTDTLWHWVDPDKTGEKYGTLVSKKAKEFGIKLRQILSEEDMSDFLTKYGHTALREKLHD